MADKKELDVAIVETYGDDRALLAADMPPGAVDAIATVMARHKVEFDEALAPFGLSHEDMLMPAWQRPVRRRDLIRYTLGE